VSFVEGGLNLFLPPFPPAWFLFTFHLSSSKCSTLS
jgi:hypothetical protein